MFPLSARDGAHHSPGVAGVPLALPAAARRRAVPPLRAARGRRLQGQLRVTTWLCRTTSWCVGESEMASVAFNMVAFFSIKFDIHSRLDKLESTQETSSGIN